MRDEGSIELIFVLGGDGQGLGSLKMCVPDDHTHYHRSLVAAPVAVCYGVLYQISV